MTVYKDLELKKSAYTRRTLAEIRSGLVIDGNSLVPEFIEDDTPVIVGAKSEEWKTCHSTMAIYLTNCEMYRSKMLLELSINIPKRFLPPPLPVVHARNEIELAKDDKDATYLSLYQNISLQNALMLAQAT